MTESVILESSDGVVQLEVPAGAVLEGTPLGIEVVDPSDVPGLEGTTPIGSAYRLVPTELVFPESLQVSYQLPISETGRSDALPLVYTVLERDGTARRALEQSSSREGDDLRHLSDIDRFGTFVLLDGGVDLTLDPVAVAELSAGDSFEATMTLSLSDGPVEPTYDVEVRWGQSGAVVTEPGDDIAISELGVVDPAPATIAKGFTCSVEGAGTYTVELSIVLSPAADDPAPNRQVALLDGEATCGDVGR
ncbi:MAG: hypothetical protein ACR2O6_07355 [Ilumatobacteraceae bacterium]